MLVGPGEWSEEGVWWGPEAGRRAAGPGEQPLEHGFTASPVHAHHAGGERVQGPGPRALEM